MAIALGTPTLLGDATSRGGPLEPTLAVLERELRAGGASPAVVRTSTAEIGAAALTALAGGRHYLVVVGGDDSVAAVVEALAGAGVLGDAVLGVSPLPAARDLARTFGLDRPPDVIARHLVTDRGMVIDVGVVECTAPGGSPLRRRFLNVAQVGYGADLVRRRAGGLRRLGRPGGLLAAYGAIRAVPDQEAEVVLAHITARDRLVNLVVANGQFYEDGSKVAPRGLPDDGILNVQLYAGERSQVFTLTTPIFRGEHLPDPRIREYQSPTVAVAPAVPLPVEADGRYLGSTPATFSLLPRALHLKL